MKGRNVQLPAVRVLVVRCVRCTQCTRCGVSSHRRSAAITM